MDTNTLTNTQRPHQGAGTGVRTLGREAQPVEAVAEYTSRQEVLRDQLRSSGLTQQQLSSLTGVSQGRISAYVNGRENLTDDMLERLLSPMGVMVRHWWTAAEAQHTRSERLSWRFHLRISELLTSEVFPSWEPKLLSNIDRQRRSNRGPENQRRIDRWEQLVQEGDIQGMRRPLIDPGPEGIRMREVSPFAGLLPQEDRSQILAEERQ